MAINESAIASRICLLAAAFNLLVIECPDKPDCEQYLAKAFYLVQEQALVIEDAIALVAPPTTIAKLVSAIAERTEEKYNLDGDVIHDSSFDETSLDTLPKYFAALGATYLLAVADATAFMTGQKAISENQRYASALVGLMASAEKVLSKHIHQIHYARAISQYEVHLENTINQEFNINGVPKKINAGDAFLFFLGFTYTQADGQKSGVSDKEHLRHLMDQAGIDY